MTSGLLLEVGLLIHEAGATKNVYGLLVRIAPEQGPETLQSFGVLHVSVLSSGQAAVRTRTFRSLLQCNMVRLSANASVAAVSLVVRRAGRGSSSAKVGLLKPTGPSSTARR